MSLALPIDALLPDVVAALGQHPALVLEAAPGAGKTTRVPAALLAALPGTILVLEPRRIAARLAARRVAAELGQSVGQTVGYQVRFERVAGPQTRLEFLTEGVLTRRLFSDPDLNGVSAVILDEFHERHVDTDLALALLRKLQQRRPDLRLVVMSATLDAAPVAHFLGACPVLSSGGRQFPLTVEHLPYSPAPLDQQVATAVELMLDRQSSGDILCFLPGSVEIRRAQRAVEPLARRAGLLVLPLYGDLSPVEQDRAVAPARERKLILATNLAESSITIDGVTAVIDSGLARVATHSPWTGLPTLTVARISQASAHQRAGRAGRTAPGHVLRLYTEMDLAQRPVHDAPEIFRADLAQLALTLRALGLEHVHSLDWLDLPPEESIRLAESLLDRIAPTRAIAAELARLPLPPRLAATVVAAARRGVADAATAAAALLSSGARPQHADLLAALDEPFDERTRQQLAQLRKLVKNSAPVPDYKHRDDALLLSLLAGFPDRVARLRSGRQLLLSSGVSAELASEPPAHEFFLAVDIEDRSDKPLPIVRLTARIEPDWLIDLFPDSVVDQTLPQWHRTGERVDSVSRLLYDQLILSESIGGRPAADAAAQLLATKALEAGLTRFLDADELQLFRGRAAFAGVDQIDELLHATLVDICQGLRSFAELRAAASSFFTLAEARIEQQNPGLRLRDAAPLTLRLPGGRSTKIHYEPDQPPYIASRLQDFFGMRETPSFGRNRTPLVLHLLAPNHRAVQTTTDLAGFWQRLYPSVRRELMRRYPRHSWPEDPLTATPPVPRR